MEARMYVFAVSPVVFLLSLFSNFPSKGQHWQLTGKHRADKFYVLELHEYKVGLTQLYQISWNRYCVHNRHIPGFKFS